MSAVGYNDLTDEQKLFVDYAKEGKNVLVDACIGSGKTTTIQAACEELPGKKILYLTYNRRLLLEARARIKLPDVSVHTFHSFAGTALNGAGVECHSERDAPRLFSQNIEQMPIYDVVMVDEYQDLTQELSDMLGRICYCTWNMRPGFLPQFLVVGDMDQKIYDYTSFDARSWADSFLGMLPGGYEKVAFTQCFRLQPAYAAELGQAWKKSIVGVNNDCQIVEEGNLAHIVDMLAQYEPSEILVLGGNNGARISIQNTLEKSYPDRFNKNTVYSSVSDMDSNMSRIDTSKAAIFTTYDSAKGLERRICVVCDYTEGYLGARLKYSTSRDVLKNLFLVAASRGKEKVVFYNPPRSAKLTVKRVGEISGPTPIDMRPLPMSQAFDYKRREDVDECLSFLTVAEMEPKGDPIKAELMSGMIDLSMCAGVCAQAVFFDNFDVDSIVSAEIAKAAVMKKNILLEAYDPKWDLQKRILYLEALTTEQERYFYQVKKRYVPKSSVERIKDRLSQHFDGTEDVEMPCSIVLSGTVDSSGRRYGDKILTGRVDAVNLDGLWEFKFVSDLKPEHMLQAALYCVACGEDSIRLWNLMDGRMLKIRVDDTTGFLGAVCRCVTKGLLSASSARLPSIPGKPVIVQIA